jgi:hypothetical protein
VDHELLSVACGDLALTVLVEATDYGDFVVLAHGHGADLERITI